MPSPLDVRHAIIREAEARAGMPYRLDPPPDGVETIDCSLYVLKVLEAAGIPLPPGVRTAEQIRQASTPIAFADAQPGDLLFFEHTYDAAGPAGADGKIASHVGISLGRGSLKMWNAVQPVSKVSDISSDYWQSKLFDIRRPRGLPSAGPTFTTPVVADTIDVSNHQGTIDWTTVKQSGVARALVKASESDWFTDAFFARNWSELKRLKMPRGAYHFARPDDGPAEEQVQFFLSIVRSAGLERDDLLVLDVEDGERPDVEEWCLTWLVRVEQLTGTRPVVYTGAWFTDPRDFDQWSAFAGYPLWLASYTKDAPTPPSPWTEVAIWQYSDKGTVPGIVGSVDLNRVISWPTSSAAATVPVGTEKRILDLQTAVAHLADVVVKEDNHRARIDEAQRIREQFVGKKP